MRMYIKGNFSSNSLWIWHLFKIKTLSHMPCCLSFTLPLDCDDSWIIVLLSRIFSQNQSERFVHQSDWLVRVILWIVLFFKWTVWKNWFAEMKWRRSLYKSHNSTQRSHVLISHRSHAGSVMDSMSGRNMVSGMCFCTFNFLYILNYASLHIYM